MPLGIFKYMIRNFTLVFEISKFINFSFTSIFLSSCLLVITFYFDLITILLVGFFILGQNMNLSFLDHFPQFFWLHSNIGIRELIVIVIIRFLLVAFSNFYQVHLSTKFLYLFRNKFFHEIKNMQQNKIDKKNEYINLFTTEFGSIMKVILLRISTLSEITILFIAILFLIKYLNFYILIILIFITFILVTIFYLLKSFIYRINLTRIIISEKIIKKINEIFYFFDYFKIYPLNNYKKDLKKNFKSFSTNEKYKQSILMNIKPFAENLGLLSLILFTLFFKSGSENLGIIVASSALIYKFLPNIIKIFNLFNEYRANKPYFEKIISSYENILSTDDNKRHIIDVLSKVELISIGYGFTGSDKILFNNLNYKFNSFGLISIIGQNGKGKSTLLKIILGIIDDYKGHVKYNDFEFSDIDKISLSKKIFYIGDRPFIVDDTLKNNLGLFNDYKFDNETKFLSSRNIDDKVSNYSLSKGEMIKVCLERIYADKFQGIIVIDEPTANLDIKTKNLLFDEINKLKKTNFIFVSTHDSELINSSSEVIEIV